MAVNVQFALKLSSQEVQEVPMPCSTCWVKWKRDCGMTPEQRELISGCGALCSASRLQNGDKIHFSAFLLGTSLVFARILSKVHQSDAAETRVAQSWCRQLHGLKWECFCCMKRVSEITFYFLPVKTRGQLFVLQCDFGVFIHKFWFSLTL